MKILKNLYTKAAVAFLVWQLDVQAWADAANHSDDFKMLYQHLEAWCTGTLGRSIALVFLLVGLGIGALRGSILGAVACLAAALSLVIAPNVINTIFC